MLLTSELRQRLRHQLRLPVMAAPMFLCSGAALAIACCKAGLIGSLTTNHCRDAAEFEQQLRTVHEALAQWQATHPGRCAGPLAVNIGLQHTQGTLATYHALCQRYGVRMVITSVGNPTEMVQRVHDWGGALLHDCTTLRFAEKAIAAGVDGIVAIGAGGGGHSGNITHLALVPQIRAMFDGLIGMAGAFGHGAAIRAAEVLGADLAYLGTRLIATQESLAPEPYKAMLVDAQASDLIYTAGINGVPASWLRPSIRANGLDPDQLPTPAQRGTGHLPPDVKPWKTLWSAGQGVGLIHDIPSVAQLVQRLQQEYLQACERPSLADAARSAPALQV